MTNAKSGNVQKQELKMQDYIRKVHYYETDKMGITHHSNYIRWLEEARVHFLNQIGYGYTELETAGIISPVTAVECQYKQPTTFGDEIKIHIEIEKFTGIKLMMRYQIAEIATGNLVATALTVHCFLDRDGRPIPLKKKFPALEAALKSLSTQL